MTRRHRAELAVAPHDAAAMFDDGKAVDRRMRYELHADRAMNRAAHRLAGMRGLSVNALWASLGAAA